MSLKNHKQVTVAYTMVDALLRAGNLVVVVDATNTTEKRRKVFVDRFSTADCDVWVKIFNTSRMECLKRSTSRPELLDVINRMWENYEPVNFEKEGVKEWAF